MSRFYCSCPDIIAVKAEVGEILFWEATIKSHPQIIKARLSLEQGALATEALAIIQAENERKKGQATVHAVIKLKVEVTAEAKIDSNNVSAGTFCREHKSEVQSSEDIVIMFPFMYMASAWTIFSWLQAVIKQM